jgi:hypothetical protein
MNAVAFGEKVRVQLRESVEFPDGLRAELNYFSHKRPYTGGPTKATASMTLTSRRGEESFSLSIHGTQGKPEIEYERRWLREYDFELVGWGYDAFVEIRVQRFDALAASYGAAFTLRRGGPIALFDDGFKVRLSELGTEAVPGAQRPARFARLDVLLDDSGGQIVAGNLYENGTPVPNGTWVGEAGLHVAGRVIALVELKDAEAAFTARNKV